MHRQNQEWEEGEQEVEAKPCGHSPTVVTIDLFPQVDPEFLAPQIAEGIQVKVNGVYGHCLCMIPAGAPIGVRGKLGKRSG